ncbi:MAG: FK506 binding protein proline rotamase rapamycin-binding protein [Watsoniomyces obsoletus]|nr:MAG: FK506 binding protein proline rotamase rapamycin-binding protein [Watsoniomyces obsoletus]
MGVTKQVLQEGNQTDYPKPGDTVSIEYTGYLYDSGKPDKKGTRFDTSVGRGDFITKIGRGNVIRGWDEGVMNMSLGEKSTLTMTSDYGYGSRGFPGRIPPDSSLVFDVELKGIN